MRDRKIKSVSRGLYLLPASCVHDSLLLLKKRGRNGLDQGFEAKGSGTRQSSDSLSGSLPTSAVAEKANRGRPMSQRGGPGAGIDEMPTLI